MLEKPKPPHSSVSHFYFFMIYNCLTKHGEWNCHTKHGDFELPHMQDANHLNLTYQCKNTGLPNEVESGCKATHTYCILHNSTLSSTGSKKNKNYIKFFLKNKIQLFPTGFSINSDLTFQKQKNAKGYILPETVIKNSRSKVIRVRNAWKFSFSKYLDPGLQGGYDFEVIVVNTAQLRRHVQNTNTGIILQRQHHKNRVCL